jgi:hypothetical protein
MRWCFHIIIKNEAGMYLKQKRFVISYITSHNLYYIKRNINTLIFPSFILTHNYIS